MFESFGLMPFSHFKNKIAYFIFIILVYLNGHNVLYHMNVLRITQIIVRRKNKIIHNFKEKNLIKVEYFFNLCINNYQRDFFIMLLDFYLK